VERHFEADRGALQSETPWENGAIHGLKRVFHPNGKVASESTYVKGLIAGQSRSYNEAGGLIRVVTYEKGKRNGEQIDYWPDKPDVAQRIIPYQNDQVVGVAKGFYLSGKLKWERPFKDNRQHGVEKQYAADGALEKTLYWLEGNPVSEEDYRAKEKK
jgi:antitoxin component YwqK of YwqJK toxin-antitoxin module